MKERFSRRHGFEEPDAEITVRNDAPSDLRAVIIDLANECGLEPTPMRRIVCRVLGTAPDSYNWSDYPNVDNEVRELLSDCNWYLVYDTIEEIYKTLSGRNFRSFGDFEQEINYYFRKRGIGWQLVEGRVEVRGSEAFEESVQGALDVLEDTGRRTSAGELHEAISDLSRRPEPDVTGAIQHSMAALECLLRDATGDSKLTLGEIMKRNPDLLPKPLNQGVEKVWGYTSQAGRHLSEGILPTFEEAELVVGLSGTVCRYLSRKYLV